MSHTRTLFQTIESRFHFFFRNTKIRSKKKNYQINIFLLDLLQANARHLWTSLALTTACAVYESLSKTRKPITPPKGVGRVAEWCEECLLQTYCSDQTIKWSNFWETKNVRIYIRVLNLGLATFIAQVR